MMKKTLLLILFVSIPAIISAQCWQSVSAGASRPTTLLIADAQGKTIRNISVDALHSNSHVIDFTEISNGMYFLTIIMDSGRETIKIVKY